MYNNYENADHQTEAVVNAYREAASLFPFIRNISDRFDGKCLNCRFEKALQEINRRIHVYKRYKWLEINVYFAGMPGREFTLAQIKLEDLPEGKRIPAALIIKSARERREHLLKQAADIENAAAQHTIFKEQLEYLTRQIDHIVAGIPWEVQDIYRLHYTVRTS